MRRPGLVLLLILGGCAVPAPPPPQGLVPEEIRTLAEPAGAIEARLAALGPLLEALPEAGTAGPEEAATIERLAREVAQIASLPAFEATPIAAGRLRARILFVTRGTRAEREGALDDARDAAEELGVAQDEAAVRAPAETRP